MMKNSTTSLDSNVTLPEPPPLPEPAFASPAVARPPLPEPTFASPAVARTPPPVPPRLRGAGMATPEAATPPPLPPKSDQLLDEEDEEDVMEDLPVEEPDMDMVKVYLRLRPHVSEDDAEGLDFGTKVDDALLVLDESTVQTVAPEDSQSFKNRETGGKYKFTKVFDKPTSQEELFRATTESLVDTFMAGKDALLFAYGVTNAGKTYTVEGSDDKPGIIPRALQLIFDRIEQMRRADAEVEAQVEVSYLQVYNDEVHDLQQPPSGRPGSLPRERLKIKLREDGVEVEGLRTTRILDCRDGLEVLARGREMRATHETECNAQSSRSHSVFVVSLNLGGPNAQDKPSRLYIVDLAGSERSKRTMASRARQREASNINYSLMSLMRCLDTMRLNQKNKRLNKKKKMVPFRESRLTLLFRDCFVGGNCGGMAMIVNASARPQDFDETAHALKYGALVKNVKMERRVLSRKPNTPGPQYGMDGRRLLASREPGAAGGSTAAPRGHGTAAAAAAAAFAEESGTLGGASISLDEHPVVSALLYELADARMQCVTMEAEIRQEVSQEMATRLEEMEAVFRKRVDAAKQISDTKSEKLLKNLRKRMAESGKSNLYSMQDIEALVQNINECEEEMERMRKLHAADISSLQRELEQYQAEAAPAGDDANAKRRKSTEARRVSLERMDRLVVDQLGTLTRYKEELAEERALHEKTIKQLESATQLAKDARVGEAEAERQLAGLRLEVFQLQDKLRKSASGPHRMLKHLSSTRIPPLRAKLARKSHDKQQDSHQQEHQSPARRLLSKFGSAPALDETWRSATSSEPGSGSSSSSPSSAGEKENGGLGANARGLHSSSFRLDDANKKGLVSRMVERMRTR